VSALDTIDMSDGIELDAFRPGLVPDMPESEYRQVEAVSGKVREELPGYSVLIGKLVRGQR
jgi:hypothetical protein